MGRKCPGRIVLNAYLSQDLIKISDLDKLSDEEALLFSRLVTYGKKLPDICREIGMDYGHALYKVQILYRKFGTKCRAEMRMKWERSVYINKYGDKYR